MRKSVVFLLNLVLIVIFCLSAASCVHKCEFSDKWSYDDSSHWRECEDGECDLTLDSDVHKWNGWESDSTSHWHECSVDGFITDTAEHEWDGGKITVAPSEANDGIRQFTCKTCERTREETVEFTGYTEDEWYAALDLSMFENFEYNEKVVASGSGFSMETVLTYKITKDEALYRVTMAGQSEEQTFKGEESVNSVRKGLIDTIRNILTYNSFEYDKQTKSYKAIEDVLVGASKLPTSDITVMFENGRLSKIHYSVTVTQSGIKVNTVDTITFSYYG